MSMVSKSEINESCAKWVEEEKRANMTNVVLDKKNRNAILAMVADGLVRVDPDPNNAKGVILVKLAETVEDVERINKELDEKGMKNVKLGIFIPNRIIKDPRLKEVDHWVFGFASKYNDYDAKKLAKIIQKKTKFSKGQVIKSLRRLTKYNRITVDDDFDEL